MIEETKKKIHFRAFKQTKGRSKDTNPAPTVIVSKKFGTITFSKGCIREAGMEGKFVRIYYEPTRKIIGWQVREKVEQEEMKIWKLCRPNKVGIWTMGIKKLLLEFNGSLTQDSYTGLPVQKYRDMTPFGEYKDQVFYFVDLGEAINNQTKV